MSSYLPIVFVLFAVALAVGPVMMLRPSKRQQKLGRLRSIAAKRGLIVQSDGAGDAVVYCSANRRKDNNKKTLKEKDDDGPVSWRLEKQNYTHAAHFFETWDWVRGEPNLPESVIARLRHFVAHLQGVSALGANGLGVFLNWDEMLNGRTPEDAISQLQTQLDQLEALLNNQNASL